MKILIYNTLGRRKEEFKPIKAGHLSFITVVRQCIGHSILEICEEVIVC